MNIELFSTDKRLVTNRRHNWARHVQPSCLLIFFGNGPVDTIDFSLNDDNLFQDAVETKFLCESQNNDTTRSSPTRVTEKHIKTNHFNKPCLGPIYRL